MGNILNIVSTRKTQLWSTVGLNPTPLPLTAYDGHRMRRVLLMEFDPRNVSSHSSGSCKRQNTVTAYFSSNQSPHLGLQGKSGQLTQRTNVVLKAGDPQQTQNIFITCVQSWTNVFDVGPTLYKYYKNVLCLLNRMCCQH